MRLLMLALIFLASNTAFAAYVNDLSEFKHHCILHRTRVALLGRQLRTNFYPEVDIRLLENYLQLHDAAKVTNQPKVYRTYGFQSPPIESLFNHYGKISIRGKDQQIGRVLRMIDILDEEIRSVFFTTFGTTHARELREIEMLADLVDRGMDPVAREEFGRPMLKASEILKNSPLLKKALWLEDIYPQMVSQFRYRISPEDSCELLLINR